MKTLSYLFIITSFFFTISLFANNRPDSIPANPKDVESAEALVAALYNVISGPAGEKRNWERMRTLFLPEGKLMATGKKPDGTMGKRIMTVEDYIATSGPFLEKEGFFEREIGRRTEQFGSVVHVFSTYDSKRKLTDEKPFMRGINSIQLWNDGKRWWIVSVFWQAETPDNPIPKKYID
jgi:hypothetical protein